MTENEEQLLLFYNIGLSITQWAHVELELSWLVASRFRGAAKTMAMSGFWAIENFRSKLEYADSIVKASCVDEKKIKAWPALMERTGKAAAKRNKLAHRTVSHFHGPAIGRRFMLVQWEDLGVTGKPWKGIPSDGIGALDVIDFRFEFFAVKCSLANFAARLKGQKATFPKESEQPNHRLTLREARNQIRELQSLPPLPLRRK